MKKITFVKQLSFFIALFCAVNFGFGQILTFDFAGLNGNEISANSNSNDPNLNFATITRGAGLTATVNGDRFNAISWALTSIANAVTGNDYMQFTISPNTGYQFNITTMVVNFQRSGTGPSAIALRSSIDGYASNIDGVKTVIDNTNTTEVFTFAVSQPNTATAVTYRVYGYAEGTSGTGGFEGPGNDIIVNGTVSALPPCPTTTTWTAGAWTAGAPTIGVNATIASNYDTGTNGSISACSLTINPGVTLTISDVDNGAPSNTYIVVQNNVTVNGTILMNPKANFVQLDDSATVTGTGTCEVEKLTAPMNNWYEYTYWSSPVFEPQIGTALSFSDASRRYIFNAQNFLDHCAETGNNGICDDNAGLGLQDDIDDNGDDWQWVNSTTVMESGVGYASTHDEAGFISFGPLPWSFKYIFEGKFNNGVVQVPLYRNDFELNDNNWNLIGNPYPSAIDADLFLAANANIDPSVTTPYTIDGAIFLWSQNTAPISTANGNQVLNFSDADYAIINGTGETVGGDGITPTNRKIPSGQAFFVSMSNSAPATIESGTLLKADNDVIFNNSMRVRGSTDNSLFFKNTNVKGKSTTAIANKLWVNLTSDNGVFNQTLVGYINGASNNDDGMYYDAIKNLSNGTSASLYTTIENSTKKFAIQGKATNSINEDEIINLGFKSTIDVPTLFKLSIAQLQGDFLSNNSIFLIDNLLNKVHDLSVCDYPFTSTVGEFNSRFEIAFTNKALSVNDVQLNTKAFKIVELQDDLVQFNTNNNLTIKTVNVYDLLGRELYRFKGENTSETFRLSNLNNTVYIAKVALSDGTVVTKKAVKK